MKTAGYSDYECISPEDEKTKGVSIGRLGVKL